MSRAVSLSLFLSLSSQRDVQRLTAHARARVKLERGGREGTRVGAMNATLRTGSRRLLSFSHPLAPGPSRLEPARRVTYPRATPDYENPWWSAVYPAVRRRGTYALPRRVRCLHLPPFTSSDVTSRLVLVRKGPDATATSLRRSPPHSASPIRPPPPITRRERNLCGADRAKLTLRRSASRRSKTLLSTRSALPADPATTPRPNLTSRNLA